MSSKDELGRILEEASSRDEARENMISWMRDCDSAIVLVKMDSSREDIGLAWGCLGLDAEMGLFLVDVAREIPRLVLGLSRDSEDGEDSC